MQSPFGAIPAMVTPLDARGEVMEGALREVIDFTIGNGVHGLFVLGSSGEIYGLTAAQKQRVVEIAVEHTAGRVPVYAGASEITTRDCIATARMVEQVGGVAGLSVLTPYFLTPNQAELIEHFTAVARSTELPVMLYENAGRTRVPIEVETCRVLSKVDNIVGIKDSSGDMTRMLNYLRVTDESFTILAGRDTMIYAALCHGARGTIASTANLAPRLVADIYEAYRAGDLKRSLDLQFALAPLRAWVERATFPVVLKEGLRLLGIDAGVCLAPASGLSEAERTELRAVLAGLPVQSTVRR
ncbi:4-hydroxy-tetrahydrodipicolinate synthase [Actinoplanes sp. URMC 104]|uniref:4-hydroxy-tetrahydrodipicolinate synthase n=1 Tax=Actinoplanes sp. URMC 104 TaxID=3423409 RepID=UPI003F194FC0